MLCALCGIKSAIMFFSVASVVVLVFVLAQVPASAAPHVTRVDLRPAFAGRGLALRNQGDRPTCSVFTLAGAIEFALAQRANETSRLSTEFLNWASNAHMDVHRDGGFFVDLWTGFATYGICREDEMPYAARFRPRAQPSAAARQSALRRRDGGLQTHWIKPWDVTTGLTPAQFDAIKTALAAGHPVCAGMRWPINVEWPGGVLAMRPPEEVRDGHSVLLVGYDDDPARPGGGVFFIRNSAPNAPAEGLLSYEFARTYINDALWIASQAGAVPAAADGMFRDVLGSLAVLSEGRNRRVSSNEQPAWNDGNFDMTWLQPGEVIEMPLLDGPGVITHMWFTSHAGWVNELNALSLRIWWDGREEPGVEVPLGDFFAVGQGKPAPVESFPVQVSPSGSLSCFWRMPFHKSARIAIRNDNPDRGAGLYWQVDWTQLPVLPPDTPYFHARFRCEYPAVMGRDYLIADIAGRGRYVGTFFQVTLAQDGWFGEGDDFFFIDGEKVPSLQGTGTEDYFNDAWGFRTRTGPWFGQPRWQGYRAGDSGACYRWHVLDPVAFSQSLRVTIEHKGNRADSVDGWYIERPDFLSSVALWYQTGMPKPFAPLPPWHERRAPWRHQHLAARYKHAKTSGGGTLQVRTEGFFGARPVLAWTGPEPGAVLRLPFTLETGGRHAVRLYAMGMPQGGRFDVEIDNRVVLEAADFRTVEVEELDLLLGTHELSAGPHTIGFRACARTAPDRMDLAVEILRFLALPPEATRERKDHNEAHFVRLGIGRALYAYRLVHNELPDTLDRLVETGMMPARYLNDENGVPLTSRREDAFFVVESPGGWTHRWQGLDPRR